MDAATWDDVDVDSSQCSSRNSDDTPLQDVHQAIEQRCGGQMYDLSGTTHNYEDLRLVNQPDYKNYLIRLKNKDDLQTIRFAKALFLLDVNTQLC